jgi:hypothetical protein
VNLVVTTIAAILMASPTVVSHIGDNRIKESSGLAYSVKHPDLVYTMNDSGNRPMVYAVQVSTGKVVGQTDLESLDLEDPESIAVDRQGRVWLGDLGDNDRDRDDVSIVSFDEPGTATAAPRALQRYPVKFNTGPSNVEAMMVYPTSGQIFLISKKNEDGGKPGLFVLPQVLTPGKRNVATNLNRPMPAGVSDATFTPDGRHALVETASKVLVYDPKTWQSVGEFPGPGLPKGESMTVEPGGRSVLMGTEGEDSPLVRLALPAVAVPTSAPTTAPATGTPTDAVPTGDATNALAPPPEDLTGPNVTPLQPEPIGATVWWASGGLLAVAASALIVRFVQRRRRLALRHRRIDQRHRA